MMTKETKILMYLALILGAFFMFKDKIMALINPSAADSLNQQIDSELNLSMSPVEEIENEIVQPKDDSNTLAVYGQMDNAIVEKLQRYFNTIWFKMNAIKKDKEWFNEMDSYQKGRINALTKIYPLKADGDFGPKTKEAFTIGFGDKYQWKKSIASYKVKYWNDIQK